MKTLTLVALAIVAVGVYMEYQKDSSFSSVDTGSVIIGTGVGLIVGGMI